MRAYIFVYSALALAFVLAGPASAGEPRTHDGFFLRLSGGIGYANTSQTSPTSIVGGSGTKLEFNGLDGDYNFAIGGVIASNLALHGTLFGWSITDPDMEVNGTKVGSFDDLTLSAMGGGVTYYIMPANIYLSGSLGLAWLSATGLSNFETNVGFGFDTTVGKEWWVGGSWGLGVAGDFGYHTVPVDVGENWSGVSFGLRFSATLN